MIAAIYARKSTEQRGADDDAKSVALQIHHARAFAVEQGWTIADEHVYFDDAVSGADVRKLRARQRLLDVIHAGAPFEVLIVREPSRFSRRDGDEAFGELKQIVRAGVAVWFYKDRQRFTFGTFGDNIVGFVKAEAAADYRRQIATWTFDALERKARAGHVTGGRVFGYDNVRVNGHVERTINKPEAAVVRDIFGRAAAGDGLKTIAKALNAAQAPATRRSPGSPGGWSPSSVREVLYRAAYRGVLVWNRTKKRDAEGHQRQHRRPQAEWVTLPAEHLRIVSDEVWQAVHDRLGQRRAGAIAAPPLLVGRGVRQRYFLTGFSRCVRCGGAMQAVSRASSGGRRFRYVCATYWNRGATVCGNGLMADMLLTDRAVSDTLQTEILQPRIIERALDVAVATLQRAPVIESHVDRLTRQLASLDVELANLAETAARGGAVPAVLDLLTRRDQDRRRVAADLDRLTRSSAPPVLPGTRILRARLQGFLADWCALLRANTPEARRVLDGVLVDRIRFEPHVDQRRYRLTISIAFERVLVAIVPELRGLQDTVASPTGSDGILTRDYHLEIASA